jgi:hypothetical protein
MGVFAQAMSETSKSNSAGIALFVMAASLAVMRSGSFLDRERSPVKEFFRWLQIECAG